MVPGVLVILDSKSGMRVLKKALQHAVDVKNDDEELQFIDEGRKAFRAVAPGRKKMKLDVFDKQEGKRESFRERGKTKRNHVKRPLTHQQKKLCTR